MRRSVLATACVAAFLLAGCGGGGKDDSDESGPPSPAPSSSPAAPSAGACRGAMITALSRAYAEAAKEPDQGKRDLAFAAAAGELPGECRGLSPETLKTLLRAAQEVAIPPG
jgi:hypothetical protein